MWLLRRLHTFALQICLEKCKMSGPAATQRKVAHAHSAAAADTHSCGSSPGVGRL